MGRLGARISHTSDGKKEGKHLQVYGVANVLQDFIGTSSVDIGATSVGEDYSRTRGQVGGGMIWRVVSRDVYTYADARYEHSIGPDSSYGYQLNVGLKMTF